MSQTWDRILNFSWSNNLPLNRLNTKTWDLTTTTPIHSTSYATVQPAQPKSLLTISWQFTGDHPQCNLKQNVRQSNQYKHSRMLPSEEYLSLIKFGRVCSAFCGADIFAENYRFNKITSAVVFCIVLYFIFSAYTIHLKFAENWTIVLEAFCMVGSVIQGITKLITAIGCRKLYRELNRFLADIYLEHETQGNEYVKVLKKCVSRCRLVLKSVGALYAFVIPSMIIFPLVILAFTGRRLLAMQFYMPYFDTETTLGYVVTLGLQSTCLLFGAFGNFAGDLFLLVYFGHASLIVDLFVLKGRELSAAAVDVGSPEVQLKLNETIKWHQTYSGFIEKIDELFYWTNFVQIVTSGLALVLTLVIIFVGNWPGAYSYLLLSFIMLYLYCGTGTLIEIANERILNEIYEIDWYNLTVSHQKCIRYMLMKAQNAKDISVAGVVPLSVNTGLQVTKSVYSIFMMLLNFFDD